MKFELAKRTVTTLRALLWSFESLVTGHSLSSVDSSPLIPDGAVQRESVVGRFQCDFHSDPWHCPLGVSLFYHIPELQLLCLCAVPEDYLIVQSRRPPTLSPPGRPGVVVSHRSVVVNPDVAREGCSEAFFLLDG